MKMMKLVNSFVSLREVRFLVGGIFPCRGKGQAPGRGKGQARCRELSRSGNDRMGVFR